MIHFDSEINSYVTRKFSNKEFLYFLAFSKLDYANFSYSNLNIKDLISGNNNNYHFTKIGDKDVTIIYYSTNFNISRFYDDSTFVIYATLNKFKYKLDQYNKVKAFI